MSNWIGFAVSVNCGEPLGCYQGTILEADGSTITLTKPFRNGFPYPKSQVTLNAADIKELKIIEERGARGEQPHSTVAVAKTKKGARATVCENLQANPSSSVSSSGSVPEPPAEPEPAAAPAAGKGGPRTKPIDIQPSRNNRPVHSGSFGNASSTPKGRGGERARRRNEACFGDAADPAMDNDFDFEGNLALFDKRALWEQMSALRPDVVRAALGPGGGGSFRHDENILGPGPAAALAAGAAPLVVVPAELAAGRDYVTDEGLRVPAAGAALRRQLWSALAAKGMADGARLLLARACADVALRLAGGGRRLDPRNAHQAPAAAVLAGAHAAGAAGLAAARLLASHGVRVAVHVAGEVGGSAALRREAAALALSGIEVSPLERLPRADLVVVALSDPAAAGAEDDAASAATVAALRWARAARAAVVALEPPACGWGGAVLARASVAALLPAALAASLGRLYLADVAPPPRLFAECRVQYRPPFGACSVLALHPADD